VRHYLSLERNKIVWNAPNDKLAFAVIWRAQGEGY